MKSTIRITNATIEQVIKALETQNKGTKTGQINEKGARAAFAVMEKYQGITRIDVRGGARVAHAYKWPHEATGLILTRNDNGNLDAVVSRTTGNDAKKWAIVSCNTESRDLLKQELGLDRYNQIDFPKVIA